MQPIGAKTSPPRQSLVATTDAALEDEGIVMPPNEIESARAAGASDGGVVVHGGLDPEQIRSVVLAHRGALYTCFELEAQKDPTLKGSVTMKWTVEPSGAVSVANVVGSTIHNERVEGCIRSQVRSWHFPSSNGGSQPTFPFSFGPTR